MLDENVKQSKARIQEKINAAISKLTAICSEPDEANALIGEIIDLQKQADIEPVELIVPCAEVSDTLDFEAYTLKRTSHGVLFSTRGGLHVFAEHNVRSVSDMLLSVFTIQNSEDVSKEDADLYASAVAYVMQAPLFASMSHSSLYGIATAVIKELNEYTATVYGSPATVESEEDVRDNIDLQNAADAFESLTEEVQNLPADDQN